jgi:hypothetical protein
MESSNDSISALESKVIELEKRLEQSLNLKKESNNSNIPNCPICYSPVELPITINATNDKKCPFSQKNPICFLCVRKLMNGKNHITCLAGKGCCGKIVVRGWRTYGEIGRNSHDVAEPSMWKALGNNGVTICKRCNTDCGDVYELGQHVHSQCPQRKIKCKRCNKLVIANNIHSHNNNCFTRCKLCFEKICDQTTNVSVINKHYCKKLKIGTCNVCNNIITIENINTHRDCTKIDKNSQEYVFIKI